MTSSPWLKSRFLCLVLLLAGVCLAAPAGAQSYRDGYDGPPGYPPPPDAWDDGYGDEPPSGSPGASSPSHTRRPEDRVLPGQAMHNRRRGPTADGGQVPLRPGDAASPALSSKKAPSGAGDTASPVPDSKTAPSGTGEPARNAGADDTSPIPPLPEQREAHQAALPDQPSTPAIDPGGTADHPATGTPQKQSSSETAGSGEGSVKTVAEAGEPPAAALDNTVRSDPGPAPAAAEPPAADPGAAALPDPATSDEASSGAGSQAPAPAAVEAEAEADAAPESLATKLGRFFFGKPSGAKKQTAGLSSPAAPQPDTTAESAGTPAAKGESLTKLIGRAVFGNTGNGKPKTASPQPQDASAEALAPQDTDAAPPSSRGEAQTADHPQAAPDRPEIVSVPAPVKSAATDPQAAPEPPLIRSVRPLPPVAPPPADELTHMIGQLVFTGFRGANTLDPGARKVLAQATAGLIGGVIFKPGNIQSPEQVRQLVHAMRGIKTKTPLFIAVDREGAGAFPAAKGFASYPSPADIGRANNLEMARATYKKMASELAALGFTTDFGPGVNVDSAPAKARHGYGPDPVRVAAFAKIYITAHHEAGLQTVLKDFPGRGGREAATAAPTDIGGAWTEAELEPYREAIRAKMTDIVMVGHVLHPKFSDSSRTPVSLSRAGVQRLLRDTIAYEGVSITGDLDADAIVRDFPLPERIIRALEAGNDMLLFSNSDPFDADLPERVIAILRDAVVSGKISRERIRTSYDRIMTLKKRMVKLQREAPHVSRKVHAAPPPAHGTGRAAQSSRPKPRSRVFPGADAP